MRHGMKSVAVAMLALAGMSSAACWAQGAAGNGQGGPRAGGPPRAPATTYEVTMQISAGAAVFKKWPGGGETWHHGIGFLDPFGTVEYYCGRDFPEAKDHPLPDWGKGYFNATTGSNDPLFCVYTTKDGAFYTYDSVPGTLTRFEGAGRDLNMNLVIDGAGAYKGATGVWIGRTEGVGPRREVTPGRMGNETLLKIMSGYVKVPVAGGAAPAVAPARAPGG